MKPTLKTATHRVVMFGEIISHHTDSQLAWNKAKKLAKDNDTTVYVESWQTSATVTKDNTTIHI